MTGALGSDLPFMSSSHDATSALIQELKLIGRARDKWYSDSGMRRKQRAGVGTLVLSNEASWWVLALKL